MASKFLDLNTKLLMDAFDKLPDNYKESVTMVGNTHVWHRPAEMPKSLWPLDILEEPDYDLGI